MPALRQLLQQFPAPIAALVGELAGRIPKNSLGLLLSNGPDVLGTDAEIVQRPASLLLHPGHVGMGHEGQHDARQRPGRDDGDAVVVVLEAQIAQGRARHLLHVLLIVVGAHGGEEGVDSTVAPDGRAVVVVAADVAVAVDVDVAVVVDVTSVAVIAVVVVVVVVCCCLLSSLWFLLSLLQLIL